MKLPKKIATLLTVTLVTSSAGNLGFADTKTLVSEEKLVGAGRWETAIEVSKKGWTSATEAIIVNDNAIADALAATPFADANNAPILLTNKEKLNEKTKVELKRLGVKKVYLIGGENVLSTNIETELKTINIEIDRIAGDTRELTALEIAKRLDKIKDISEIAVVNGTTGLSDAASIAAAAADKDMAIILSNQNNGTKASDDFIKSEDIKTSYVIGGVNAISKEVESKLPNTKRIEGINRNETNAKVIETFYTEKEIKNVYVAKDGMKNESQLIDALAVGVLAAKNDSPVILVGNKLNQMQKDVTNTKSFKTVTQVGGNGNENAFNELKTMQGVTTYKVTTVKELNDALAKADANDIINVDDLKDNTRNGKVEIASKNAVKVNLNNTGGKSVVVNVKSGTLTANGAHTSIDIKGGDLVINGTIEAVNVLEGGEVTVDNKGTSKPNITVEAQASVEVAGTVNAITVSGKDAAVSVAKDAVVSKVEVSKEASGAVVATSGKVETITVNAKDAAVSVSKDAVVSKVEVSENASGAVIENAGKVDKVESNAPNVNVENSGTVGSVSGTNKPTVDNTQGGTVNKPSTGGGSSSGGGVTQNPTVSGVSVTTDGDNITIMATAKNYGSRTAKVEVIKEETVVTSVDDVEILNGTISHTFEGVEIGTYTVKVTVGSASAISEQFDIQNPTVSGVSITTNGDNITVTATAQNYGSKLAKVELIKEEETVVESEENIKITNGSISHTFEGVENGTYTVKVTIGSVNASSKSFTLNVWDGTEKTEATPNENGVYEISTPSQLAWISDFVNKDGNTTISIKLMNDIDLNNEQWTPIGEYPNQFRGSFDGGNHTIKNLSINNENGSDLGLFGYTNSGINVKNVTLDGVNIVGNQRIGSLVGSIFDEGTSSNREEIIENCHVKNANLTAELKDVAGLVGYGYVNIDNCSVDNANIRANDGFADGDNVGGVIGNLTSERTISNVKVNNVTLSGHRKVGGVAGSANDANIVFENCKVTGDTSINVRALKVQFLGVYPFAGGIVGESVIKGITVKDCSVDKSTVSITGNHNELLGWFVGGSRANKGESLKDGDINFVGNSFDENIIQ